MKKNLVGSAFALILGCCPAFADGAEVMGWNNPFEATTKSHNSLVSTALAQTGVRWKGRRWCQRWLNTTLVRSGYKSTGSDKASSVLKWPRTAPRPGVVVYWPSHSALIVKVDGPWITVVSGNWSRKVSVHVVHQSRVAAFVQPQT